MRSRSCRGAFSVIETLEKRVHLAAHLTPDFITYRIATGKVMMDTNDDYAIDRRWFAGQAGDQITAGDFDGNTVDDIATYRDGLWSIDLNSDGGIDRQIAYGDGEQIPLMGDVNGDGFADLIIYNRRTGVWVIDSTRDGVPDAGEFPFFLFGGQAGDAPLLGDLDGDGRDEPIIYRNGTWMTDPNRDGKADQTFTISNVPVGRPVLVNWGTDYRTRAGVVVDGHWYIDSDDDRFADVSFRYGYGSEIPLTGFFNTANSIFVQEGAQGTGGVYDPLGSISEAVAGHRPGQIIRVAAGVYRQNIVAFRKDDMSILGAGMNATYISPGSGDGLVVILGSNTWLNNLHFSGGGRGLISLGGDIHARYISTVGVRDDGMVANDSGEPEVRASRLDISYSNFNSSQRGYGMWLQGHTDAKIWKTTFNNNGTDPSLVPNGNDARGLVVSENASAVVRQSMFDGNFNTGLAALENSTLFMRRSVVRYNREGNGAMFLGNANVDLERNRFDDNGLIRDPNDLSRGRNGIEFYRDYRGQARVVNNTFVGNTGFGIFMANGDGLEIRENLFDNNWCGMGLEGLGDRSISATIQGNTFRVPETATYETGIFIYGPNAHVKLGGSAGAQKNSFTNFGWQRAIVLSPFSESGEYIGYPDVPLKESDNTFVNSPDPIRYVEVF